MKSSFAVNHAAPLANLGSHAHAQAIDAPRHAEVRIIGIEQVRDARIDRSIYPSSFIPLPPFAKVNGVHP